MPPVVAALAAPAFFGMTVGTVLQVGAMITLGVVQSNRARAAERAARDAYNASVQDRTVMFQSGVAPSAIIYGRTKISGPIVYAQSTGDKGDTLHLVIGLAMHPLDAIEKIYLGDVEITPDADGWVRSGDYAPDPARPNVYVARHLGAADQSADPVLVAASAGKWTADHAGKGVAYLYVQMRYHEQFGQGAPNVSAVVRGKPVFDPRTGATAWSDNAALCIADYLRDGKMGIGSSADEVPATELAAAASLADEMVESLVGQQKRYTINGAVSTENAARANLDTLLAALQGTAIWAQGRWLLRAGAYRVPVMTLDEDCLAGGNIEISSRAGRQDTINRITGTYIDEASKWAEQQYPAVESGVYKAQDGGVELTAQRNWPLLIDSARAQRLARIELERARQSLRVTLRCNLKAYDLLPSDTVRVNVRRYGWNQKVFQVLSRSFDPAGALTYQLIETAPSVWAWSSSQEVAVDPAPNTDLANPLLPPASVAGLAATTSEATRQVMQDGGVVHRALVSWEAVADGFVRAGGRVELGYRRSDESAWSDGGSVPGDQTSAYIGPISPSGSTQVRARTVTALGRLGAWVAVNVNVEASITLPAVPALSLEKPWAGSAATIVWGLLTGARSYTVQVWAAGALRRTLPGLTQPRFEYSAQDLAQDGGPWRSIEFRVRAESSVSAVGAWSSLTVNNPQIPALQGLAVLPGPRSGTLTFAASSDADWAGVLVWLSTDPAVPQTAANLIYDGPPLTSLHITALADKTPLAGGASYYVRAAGFDALGRDGLAVSSSLGWTAQYTVAQQLDAALSSSIDSSATAKVAAEAQQRAQADASEAAARQSGDQANTSAINAAVSRIGTTESSIVALQQTQVNDRAATATRFDAIQSSMAVGALNSNAGCNDLGRWTSPAGGQIVGGSVAGKSAIRWMANRQTIDAAPVKIRPGRIYRLSVRARSDGAANLYLTGVVLDAAGANIPGNGSYWYVGAINSTVPTDWTEYAGTIGTNGTSGANLTLPANAATIQIGGLFNYGNSAANWTDIEDLLLTDVTDSVVASDAKASITALQQTVTSNQVSTASQINQISTTLGGHTSTLSQYGASINGLSAQWSLQLDAGGAVAGIYSQAAGGRSEITLAGDVVKIAGAQGKRSLLAVYTSRTQVMPGVWVDPGTYISGLTVDYLRAAQIDTSGLVVRGANGRPVFASGDVPADAVSGLGALATKTNISTSGNLLPNSDFSDGTNGWTVADYGSGVNYGNTGINKAGPYWQINRGVGPSTNNVTINSGAPQGSYAEWASLGMPVGEGSRVIASAHTAAHRCEVVVFAYFYAPDGSVTGHTDYWETNAAEKMGGNPLAGWKRTYGRGIAPAGTAYMRLILRKMPTKPGYSDSWLFASRCQLEVVGADVNEPTPWSLAGVQQGDISAAQRAAQAYAQAQADLAAVIAKAYADGKVTAEEQRAIGDAAAKAEAARAAAVAAASNDATAKANQAATTANWSGVSGPGKPQDNATVGATIGQNLGGRFDPTNASTYISEAAITSAMVKDLYAEKITAGFLDVQRIKDGDITRRFFVSGDSGLVAAGTTVVLAVLDIEKPPGSTWNGEISVTALATRGSGAYNGNSMTVELPVDVSHGGQWVQITTAAFCAPASPVNTGVRGSVGVSINWPLWASGSQVRLRLSAPQNPASADYLLTVMTFRK